MKIYNLHLNSFSGCWRTSFFHSSLKRKSKICSCVDCCCNGQEKLWLKTFHSIFTQWMRNYGTKCHKYIYWLPMLANFLNMHHKKLWVKTNYSSWSIIFPQKIAIIGATIQKETLKKSSRPMIDKMSYKGELIQFELRESISTQTNAHH